MKRLRITLTIAFLSAIVWLPCVPAIASEEDPAASPVAAILPTQFAGWEIPGAAKIKTSRDPAAADPVNAALLKEYGFTDFASATYIRKDGRKLVVRAARFGDASGADGAFT
jgi:hypothetical protein